MFVRHSPKEVLLKRFQRLFIPLVLTIVFIGPLVHVLLANLSSQEQIISLATFYLPFKNTYFNTSTLYVWFLYYLFLFSLIHLVARYFGVGRALFNKPKLIVYVLCMAIAVMGILTIWQENILFGQYGLIPSLGSLGGYFVFYIFGILLFERKHEIQFTMRHVYLLLLLGTVFFVAFSFLSLKSIQQNKSIINFDFRLMICASLAMVFYTLGFIGLAIKKYTRPNEMISNISRSSYFLYLIHFPLLLVALNIVVSQNWHAFAKFTVVLMSTVAASLLANRIWKGLWKNKPPI